MSVLVFCSSPDGELKKSAVEVVTYGKKTAEVVGGEVIGTVESHERMRIQFILLQKDR